MSDKCAPRLERIKQVGAIVETVCGEGGAFVAADFKLRVSALDVTVDMSPIEDDTYKKTLSPSKLRMGEKKATVKVAGKLVGSGVPATKPEAHVYLVGCGMQETAVQGSPIGAITGGPFVPGETITQAVSLATGVCVAPAYTGDTKLYFVVTSGTFNSSGIITGAVSGATTTPSAIPAASGWYYRPLTTGTKTIAVKAEEDGFSKTVLGGAGTFTITSESSNFAKAEFTINGKMGDFVDSALTDNVTYATTDFPLLLDAMCELDRGKLTPFEPILRSVAIDLQGEATLRKDANDTTGLIASKMTNRTPSFNMVVESMLAEDFDIYTKMKNSTGVTLSYRWVSPNSTVWVFGTNAQITGDGPGATDGFLTNDLSFRMNGISGDDEFRIVFIDA